MNVAASLGAALTPENVGQLARRARAAAAVAARWLVAIVLLGFVLSRVDLADVAGRLGGASLPLAALAVTGLVAVQVIGAWSWRRLVQRMSGIRVSGRSTLAMYYAAQAIGFLTPGNLGADVYRLAALSASGRRAAGTPILAQRITSTFALGLLAAIAAWELPEPVWTAPPVLAAGAILAILAIGAAILAWRARRRPGSRVRATLNLVSATGDVRRAWRSVVVDGLGLGLAFHGVSLGLGLLAVAAIDPATAVSHPVEVLAALTIARLWLVIPVSPSGLGVQEGALALLFVQLGLQPDVALAALVLNRLALLVTVAIGAAAIAASALGSRHPADARTRPRPPRPPSRRVGPMGPRPAA